MIYSKSSIIKMFQMDKIVHKTLTYNLGLILHHLHESNSIDVNGVTPDLHKPKN